LVFHSSTITMMHGPINIRFSFMFGHLFSGTSQPTSAFFGNINNRWDKSEAAKLVSSP